MNRTKQLLLILLLSSTFMISCDCEFNYEFNVINETQTEIKVEFVQGAEQKKITVKPNENKTLVITDGFRCGCTDCKGSRINSVDSTMNYLISDIKILKNDTVETKIDFNNEYNWEFESRKKLGLYTARIDNSDF